MAIQYNEGGVNRTWDLICPVKSTIQWGREESNLRPNVPIKKEEIGGYQNKSRGWDCSKFWSTVVKFELMRSFNWERKVFLGIHLFYTYNIKIP